MKTYGGVDVYYINDTCLIGINTVLTQFLFIDSTLTFEH
jgi:hypothetical protein